MRRKVLLLLAPMLMGVEATELSSRDGANLQSPVWAPDGNRLAYEANFHDIKSIELFVGDADTRQFTMVTPIQRGTSQLTLGFASQAAEGTVAHEISWAPPPLDHYVYAASGDLKDYDLYLSGAGALATAPGADGGPAWSPDGRFVAFTSARTGQGDIYLLDMSAVELPPRQLTSDPTAAELFVVWSPDGQRMAWVGHTDHGDNIWVADGLDAAPRQLTEWSRSQLRPTFSPDGEKVAFYSNHDAEDRFDLYVVGVKSGPPVLLAKDVELNTRGPTWAPDGRHVLYVANDDTRFDPLSAVTTTPPFRVQTINVGTVSHGDLDVTSGSGGGLRIAFVAQGKTNDPARDYKRLFLAEVTRLQ